MARQDRQPGYGGREVSRRALLGGGLRLGGAAAAAGALGGAETAARMAQIGLTYVDRALTRRVDAQATMMGEPVAPPPGRQDIPRGIALDDNAPVATWFRPVYDKNRFHPADPSRGIPEDWSGAGSWGMAFAWNQMGGAHLESHAAVNQIWIRGDAQASGTAWVFPSFLVDHQFAQQLLIDQTGENPNAELQITIHGGAFSVGKPIGIMNPDTGDQQAVLAFGPNGDASFMVPKDQDWRVQFAFDLFGLVPNTQQPEVMIEFGPNPFPGRKGENNIKQFGVYAPIAA